MSHNGAVPCVPVYGIDLEGAHLLLPFLAPLKHAFYPDSKVKQKPHLKEIEIVFTACTLVYPDIKDRMHQVEQKTEGIVKTHMRNLRILFEFFLPVVNSFCDFQFYFCC